MTTVKPALGGVAPGAGIGGVGPRRMLDATTTVVFQDEPCFFLAEMDLPARNGRGKSRYQLLRIVRNDRLVTAYIHLGPSSRFKADQFNMLGGVIGADGRGQADHTVAELQAGADELRGRKPRREMAPSDLQRAWSNHVKERGRRRRHISTFGHGGHLQRP